MALELAPKIRDVVADKLKRTGDSDLLEDVVQMACGFILDEAREDREMATGA